MNRNIKRRDWLQTNAAALGWLMAGMPGIARGGEQAASTLAPRQPRLIRLCYNENPHGPGPEALAAISEQMRCGNRYGLQIQLQLRSALATANRVPMDHIVLGSGSSEILALATALGARNGPGQILMGSPTFTAWLSPAGQLGLETKGIELNPEHRLDLPAMAAAVTDRTRMVYLCNPGNPTGTVSADKELRDFIRQIAPRTLLVVDEAYFEYVGSGSVADLTQELPNLLVTRTFSKFYGLAGLRVGYGIGQKAGALAAREGWPNVGVSSLSMAAALASLQDQKFGQEVRQKNRQAMDYTAHILSELGLEWIPSAANFLMFNAKGFQGDLTGALATRGVQARSWSLGGKHWCRVSIGTLEEMGVFIDQLKAVLKS